MIKEPLKTKSFIEVAFLPGKLDRENKTYISQWLLDAGIQPERHVSIESKTKPKLCFYTRSTAEVQKVKHQFGRNQKGIKLQIKVLEAKDWFDKWKRDYHSIALAKSFMLIPIWEKKRNKQGKRIPIYLDPKGAFGSGQHETTQLMIELLEKLKGKYQSFLDIGVGTGILSVAAAKLGAVKVIGFDLDGPSIKAARYNLKLNACQGLMHKERLENYKSQAQFDLVGANLLSHLLIANRNKLVSCVRKHQYLMLSGILKDHLPEVRKAYQPLSLRCLRVLRGKKWGALLYKKS